MDSTIQKLDEKMECPDTLEALPGFIITSVQPRSINEVSIYFEKGMIGDSNVMGLRQDILNTYSTKGCDTWEDVFASQVASGWVRARFSGEVFSYVRANPRPRNDLLESRFQNPGHVVFPGVSLEDAQEPVPYHRPDEHKIDTAGMTMDRIQSIVCDIEDEFKELFTSMNNYPVYRESGMSYNDYGKQIERTYTPTLSSSTASSAVVFPFFGRVGSDYLELLGETLSLFGFDVESAELTRSERRVMRNCVYNHGYPYTEYWGLERLRERFPDQTLVGVTTKHIPNKFSSPILGRYYGFSDFIMLATYRDYKPKREGNDFILPFIMDRLSPEEVGGCLLHELGEKFGVRRREGFRDNHHYEGDPEFKVCLMTSGNHYFDHASGNFYRGYPGLDPLKLEADSFTRNRRRYLEDGFCNSCRTTLENVLDIDLSWTAMN